MPRLNGSQSTRIFQWMRRPLITDQHAPPINDHWYEVLNQGHGARIHYIWINQGNTEAAAKSIAIQIVIEGVIHGTATNLDSDDTARYYHYMECDTVRCSVKNNEVICGYAIKDGFANVIAYSEFLSAHNIVINYKIASPNGTAQTMRCIVEYDTWEQVP